MKPKPTTVALVALLSAPGWAGEHTPDRQPPPIPLPQHERPHPGGDKDAGRRDRAIEEFERPNGTRSIDGYGNNLGTPEAGTPGHPMIRLFPSHYVDGTSEPAGADQPSAREVSNAVATQIEPVENRRGATDYLWQWGQFLDHDITETPTAIPEEPFDIPVPTGDGWFDPAGTGSAIIAMNRSHGVFVAGVREQVNRITAFIDGSNVYGSDEVRANALRNLDGSGTLRTTNSDHGPLLPYNDGGHANAPDESPAWFLAGDVRANEQVGLTALHTLFVREHNHWARSFRDKNPTATEDDIFEFARLMVGAEIQHITYREFLPVLLGRGALPPYRGYHPDVDPSISNEFATAAFRLGHSLVPEALQLSGADGSTSSLPLAEAFFDPSLVASRGVDRILRGLAIQRCQELDGRLVDGVRNFLFGPPGAAGFDLAALNIQRGRDHGLPGYNEARHQLGLPPARQFRDVNPDPEVHQALAEVYSHVDDIDLWVGGLCEPHLREAMVGPVFHRILLDQFLRLRDGDRFWYEHALEPELLSVVREQSLATIIRRNTEIGEELQDQVFLLPGQARPLRAPDATRRNARKRQLTNSLQQHQ